MSRIWPAHLEITENPMPIPLWARYCLGAIVAVLIALLLAPLIPAPGGGLVAVVAWIVAAVLIILTLFALITGPRV